MRRGNRSARLLALGTAALLAAAGCGSNSSDKTSTPKAGASGASSTASGGTSGKNLRVGVVYDVGGRGDKSFNDAAYAGLVKAQAELGVKGKDLSPDAGGTNREELLKLLADGGYNPIITVGFSFSDAVTKVAPKYPKTNFAIIDAVVKGSNVASLTFGAEQSSFLVGAAAALKSKTHHVGYIGGVSVPLLKTFQAGFDAGAKKVDPKVKIDDKYLTNPPDLSGFNSPSKGKEAANGMYDAGADVIYAAAGGSGTGVFQAAKAKGKLAIGVDSDQYLSADPSLRPVIMTSALKRVDVAVFDFINDFSKGKKDTGEQHFDLKNNGVGYSVTGGAVNDIKPKLEQLRAQIISGAIKVPTTPTK
ncbi:MAG: BMP family ABC transporter substrate-binding protein [Frankiaceae bacterium]